MLTTVELQAPTTSIESEASIARLTWQSLEDFSWNGFAPIRQTMEEHEGEVIENAFGQFRYSKSVDSYNGQSGIHEVKKTLHQAHSRLTILDQREEYTYDQPRLTYNGKLVIVPQSIHTIYIIHPQHTSYIKATETTYSDGTTTREFDLSDGLNKQCKQKIDETQLENLDGTWTNHFKVVFGDEILTSPS